MFCVAASHAYFLLGSFVFIGDSIFAKLEYSLVLTLQPLPDYVEHLNSPFCSSIAGEGEGEGGRKWRMGEMLLLRYILYTFHHWPGRSSIESAKKIGTYLTIKES